MATVLMSSWVVTEVRTAYKKVKIELYFSRYFWESWRLFLD